MSDDANYPQTLGIYRLLKLIGSGGMGKIFLAEDPICERYVALKQILPTLLKYPSIRERFLLEAKIAAQLNHPSIISIYSLHIEKEQIYYTMPHLKGKPLKSILKRICENETQGRFHHPLGSIPALIRIFFNICQAVDYTHANGFLHRDLKPGNIIVGHFGEVTLLDWGIAKKIDDRAEEIGAGISTMSDALLTRPSKVVGTVGYMAPERALGYPSTTKSDIYSLGILLYQLLTLRLPFARPSIEAFRKSMHRETWIEPQKINPYRDIPTQLSHIAKKCIEPLPQNRYASVRDILNDLEAYIEGRPEWTPHGELFIDRPEDWGFQENVLIAHHIVISQLQGEWVILMISKESYSGNVKVEADITLSEDSLGIGLLMCVPNANEEGGLEESYLIWIESNPPSCQLFRTNVEVMAIPNIALQPGETAHISLEKVDNHLYFSLNGTKILDYFSHIPLIGGHVGILSKDGNYPLHKISISLVSQNIMVNCLSVPDAFLTKKRYRTALREYRQIANSFHGRPEGKEAIFRAGIALLEQGKNQAGEEEKQECFRKAFDEFEKLRAHGGSPLEYLGKSLMYRAEKNLDDEIKCLALTLQKYPKHPFIPKIEEHIIYRLHQMARYNRKGTYTFSLLVLTHLPKALALKETRHLMQQIAANWQELPFIANPPSFSSSKAAYHHIAIQLAFRLTKPIALYELTQRFDPNTLETPTLLTNVLFSLLEINNVKLAQYISHQFQKKHPHLLEESIRDVLNTVLNNPKSPEKSLALLLENDDRKYPSVRYRAIRYSFQKGLTLKRARSLLPYFKKANDPAHLPSYIWACLLTGEKERAGKLLKSVSQKMRSDPLSPYHFLHGCHVTATRGKEEGIAHLTSKSECLSTIPLFIRYLIEKTSDRPGPIKSDFSYENIALYRQLSLYHFCLGDEKRSIQFEKMSKREADRGKLFLHFP